MNIIYLYIYVFLTFLIAVYLILKSGPTHKYITFIIAYWILAGSVLNTEYFIIDIERLPFDLQPNRIIFILFTIYLILVWAGKIKNVRVKTREPKFEKYLFLYISLSIVIDVIHTVDILTTKDIILNSTQILTFLVIYLVLKRTADREMINVFIKSLLIACIFSSLIGIYQFLVNPFFFRLGSERLAYAGLLRSNGIFHAEYIQSYFLIMGIVLILFTIPKKLLKYSLLIIFLTAIIFTFHRMSWIVLIIILTLYLIEVKKKKVWQMAALGSIAILLVFLLLSNFPSKLTEVRNSPFIQDRLFADTMTGRIGYYKMVLRNIPQNWLIGFGSRKSDVYYYGMLEAGASKSYALGEEGGIHNGYLEIMFYNGIPSLILYLLFNFLIFLYFWRLAGFKHIFYFIPLFVLIMNILSNLTNGFPLSSDLGLLLAVFLGIGVAAYQKNIDMSRLINEKIYK
jgi:O-antigen ligase